MYSRSKKLDMKAGVGFTGGGQKGLKLVSAMNTLDCRRDHQVSYKHDEAELGRGTTVKHKQQLMERRGGKEIIASLRTLFLEIGESYGIHGL